MQSFCYLVLTVSRQDSPTTISYLSSYPATPNLSREPSEIRRDINNTSVKPLNDGYRISNRRFRQLTPLELKSNINLSITVNDNADGLVNHAYSTDSLYDPISKDDVKPSASLSAPATDIKSIRSQQLNDTSLVPSALPNVSISQIPSRTALESLRHMWSVSCKLMRNTRYVCIVIANLFEGILIKGTSKILFNLINRILSEYNFI